MSVAQVSRSSLEMCETFFSPNLAQNFREVVLIESMCRRERPDASSHSRNSPNAFSTETAADVAARPCSAQNFTASSGLTSPQIRLISVSIFMSSRETNAASSPDTESSDKNLRANASASFRVWKLLTNRLPLTLLTKRQGERWLGK